MRFWDITPDEMFLAADGHQRRIEAEWTRAAAIAAWIRQAWGAKETADKLLGGAFRRQPTQRQEPNED